MKKEPPLLLLVICLAACMAVGATTTDTTQPKPLLPQLKEKKLTVETLIANGSMVSSKKLNRQQLMSLSLKAIDKGFAPTLQYHLIDTLYRGNGHYILLLGQWYDFENKAWVASYATPHRLIDFRQVFYDNAEGFLSVETQIKDNTISITTLNDYETGAAKRKTERLKFGTNYKLQKL